MEPSSLTWLGSSLVDMIWSIDIELDELVVESRSSESTSHQKNGEKDKQVLADLVKKLLVRKMTCSFVRGAEQLHCRPSESFNQVLVERGLIVAWYLPQALVLTSRTGISARSERGRAFCWSDFALRVYPH